MCVVTSPRQISTLGELAYEYEAACTGSSHHWNTVTHECRVNKFSEAQKVITVRQTLQHVPSDETVRERGGGA